MASCNSIWWSSADGGRLHALDWPGPADLVPIVGLPGLTRTARDFQPLADWLGGRRRVIAVDLRGRGRSDCDPDAFRYGMSAYVKDVGRLLDAIGAPRAILVGGSNGGVLAALYAARHPDRVAGLVFNDVAHRFAPEAFAEVLDEVRAAPAWPDWRTATEAMRERHGAVHPRYGQAEWAAFARRTLRQDPDGSVVPDFDPRILVPLESAGAGRPFDLLPVYRASAHLPCLLLRGTLSRFLTAAAADEFIREVPCVERVEVPDVGHLPDLAEPASVAAIERFLVRVGA